VRRIRTRPWLATLAGAAFVALPAGAGASIASLGAAGAHTASDTHPGSTTASALAVARRADSPVAHAGACAGRSPSRLRLKRLRGTAARLSWRAPGAGSASGGLAYRVFRAGRTVGQTARPSMVLAVTPGRRTTFSVQARYANGALKCSAKLTETVPVRKPSAVPGLKVLTRTAGGVTIGWRTAHRGDAPVIGYRVTLDGAVAGQTHSLHYQLIFNSARSHRVAVAAVDTRGRLGSSSGVLVVSGLRRAAGAPPSTPQGLSASEVGDSGATVLWLPSSPGATPLSGYDVYRDGKLVGHTKSTSMHLTHLSFPKRYRITVTAVDTDGAESAPTAPLVLGTVHPAPRAPSLLSAVSVTDTSATLSWQAGSAAAGTVTGYLLFKDGQPVGFVQGQIVTVTLASERRYTFTVRTRDSAGYLSAPSPELTVVTTHTPPPAPREVSASSVTSSSARISWQPSAAVSGTIVGYRVFRDGIPVGQGSSTERMLESLAPASVYTITVSAVDSLGAVSEPSAPLMLHTADPPPTHGNIQAYLLATTDESFEDLQAHYQQIGVLYPTYYECGPGGSIVGKDDPLVTKWALARKIEVLPRLNCLNSGYEEAVLNQPSTREKLIGELAAMCANYGYTGVQIDFENAPASERDSFTSFITTLAERLHAQGDKLSTVVTAKYWNVPTGRAAMYNDAALSVPSDYVFVLDWGYHWLTSGPGSIDDYSWFSNVAKYTATMPNLNKFVLGMPMYGVDWPESGGSSNPGTALQYSEIVALAANLRITPEWDQSSHSPHFSYTAAKGVHHEVWYVNQRSLSERATLANTLKMKLGVWRLGREDQTIWQLPLFGGEEQ
jgi:spore germination protein YaaH